MNLMIVEDNVRMRESIERFLVKNVRNIGTTLQCRDGIEAVASYDRFRPDWVLMDIEMGPTDGFTASRAILHAHPDARIIILTSHDDARYRETAHAVGAHAYVLKENLQDIPGIIEESSHPSE